MKDIWQKISFELYFKEKFIKERKVIFMSNPYQVLGISPSATKDEIKKAYRKLARTLHPDVNPNNKEAADKFKEVAAAYDLLSDDEKRRRFDAGEIDEQGRERAGFNFRPSGNGSSQHFYYTNGAGGETGGFDFSDIFSAFGGGTGGFSGADMGDIFSGRRRSSRRSYDIPGENVSYQITVDFKTAVLGGEREVRLQNGKSLKIKIPSGTSDGAVLRLKGQGMAGTGKAPAGDALIHVSVSEHPYFSRQGDDILLTLPITLKEAVLGGKIVAPTLYGDVYLNIPPMSGSGKVLRLKGKGVKVSALKSGDQLVKLEIVLPETPDKGLEEYLKSTPDTFRPRDKISGSV
jgi:DnaJ-class molecular chaperone